jgi:hypothetical protein
LEEEEFHIDEVYRFEGNANPLDNSVVYAFTSPSGVKGTIVDRLGEPADNISLETAGSCKTIQACSRSITQNERSHHENEF